MVADQLRSAHSGQRLLQPNDTQLHILIRGIVSKWIRTIPLRKPRSHILDQCVIPVFSAQLVISIDSELSYLSVLDLQDRHIESPSPKIEDKHLLITIQL